MKDSVMSSAITASGTSPALAKQLQQDDTASIHANLIERFEILKFLGTSRSSFCFAARDLAGRKTLSDPGRMVRLKVLSDDAAVDEVQRELFYLEAAAAAKLSHQNITRTTEAEELGGVHFYTIEQSSNAESLRGLLDIRSWLEINVAVSIALQVADALDHAHQKGVLHLNLKPENILIEADGRVLVTEFGIGSQRELAWAHSARSGSQPLRYSSPEQIQGPYADCSSDLYSVGIILFEMLTDRVPFDSTDEGLIKRKHLTQAPHSPQLFRHGISNYLSALVLTLLEKNADWRFRTAAQLQMSLSRVAQTELGAEAEGGLHYCNADEDSPELDSQSVEATQSAELDFTYPQTDFDAPDVASDNISPPRGEEAEAAQNPIIHREFFEPPTIIKIDPPPPSLSERSTRIEPSSSTSTARENIQPFSLYASSDKSQSRRQALAFLALMLVILLVISLLGRNYLPGLFLTSSAAQQNNLPDTLATSHITDPGLASPETVLPVAAEQAGLDETQGRAKDSGLSASVGSLPTVIPPRRKAARRPRPSSVTQSVRRKLQAKRKIRKPGYLKRARGWAGIFNVNDRLKLEELQGG